VSPVDRTFAALSDPTRRSVVELLGKRPYRAGELAEMLETSPPAMSRHLRILRTSGLVEEDHGGEDARVRVYRLRHDALRDVRRWLEGVETYWERQLESFAKHAERTRGRRGMRS
jgi:DNA-binding transcriptional ArsR family regulator